MITIYGTMQCPDCVECKRVLDNAGVRYIFKNIEELMNLKEFLKLRDENRSLIPSGSIGIPFLVLEDGSVTLEYNELAKQ